MVRTGHKNKKADKNQAEHDEKLDVKVVQEENPATEEAAPEAIDHQLLRLQADFDNFRKRMTRERAETYARANEDLMSEIIPVLDHMDMALRSAADHDAPQALLDGVGIVAEQLKGVLQKFGLEKIDASGKEFDPNEHEAISHLPSNSIADNMVMEQTRLGYKLKGRILRPAQVVVSSGAQNMEAAKEPEAEG